MKIKQLVRVLLSLIVSISVLFFILIKTNFIHFPKEHAPQIDEPLSTIVVSVKDYKVYNFKDVPFRFILANINLVNNKPIEFELSRFMTSEQVRLDKIDNYKSEISAKGYDLSKQNVTNILTSSENSVSATILIPIKNNHLNEISVYVAGVEPSQLIFNLNWPYGKSSDLGKDVVLSSPVLENNDPDEVIETDVSGPDQTISNTITLSAAMEIDPSLISIVDEKKEVHRVNFKLTSRAYVVNVNVDYVNEVVMSAARLNFEKTQELVFALGPEYAIDGKRNVLMRPMTQGDGYLIFIVDDSNLNPLNQPYKIEVRMNNQVSWIELLIK
ncbi:MAG: hypothetical protein GXY98_02615 [Erysipelothrix sp.]|nr:hypothetical protein [Erysipelothrix sp.]